MKNGLSPKTQLLALLVLASGAFAFLVSRPKTVVKDEVKAVQSTENGNNVHMENPQANKMADDIRAEYAKDPNPLNVYAALAEMFYKTSVFDSSAYYSEQIAIANPGGNTWLKTGDAYLQAYNLALNPVRVTELAEKAREAYNYALKFDPNNLQAKTNIGLTYVNSDNPMRAIGIIREVLEQNPKYIPALMSLGKLSMQSQQFDRAVERFKEVLQIDQQYIDARIGLAYSYIELKKTDDARAILSGLLKEDLDPIVKDEITKSLNNLK